MTTPIPDPAALVEPVDPDAVIHEWAGDEFEGDPSDPTQAFAALAGVDGEQAWLDRAEDGTLTGWVQDADSTVFRYSDVNAWAIDVDQSGMQRSDTGEALLPDAEEAPLEELDEAGGFGEPTDPEEDAPGDVEDLIDEDEAPGADPFGDEPLEDPDLVEDDEDEKDEFPFEGKSWTGATGIEYRAVPA